MTGISNTKKVIRVDSDTFKTCPYPGCGHSRKNNQSIDVDINHMLNHGAKLIHIGQETSIGGTGPYQMTVAIFSVDE